MLSTHLKWLLLQFVLTFVAAIRTIHATPMLLVAIRQSEQNDMQNSPYSWPCPCGAPFKS